VTSLIHLVFAVARGKRRLNRNCHAILKFVMRSITVSRHRRNSADDAGTDSPPREVGEEIMTHYSVVSVTPTSEAWIPSYLQAVGPLVQQYGGRYLARTASHEQLEGDATPPALQVIIEWPSKDAADSFYKCEGYAPQLTQRLAGSQSAWSSIEGKDDFA
jgi:uncharacterized protein (DUF1330 family)